MGIAPNKRVLNCKYRSAIMFPPQDSIGGDVVRFKCNLDKNAPSMRHFNLKGIQRHYTSCEYYFDEGMLEVEPDNAVCIFILFSSENNVYEMFPEIIAKLNGNTEAIPVPARRRGIVCPSGVIPNRVRMMRTFRDKPPLFENDLARFNDYLQY